MNDWKPVARALLGRWPSQVATWGEEGIAAFVEELQVDGLAPDDALVAIRTYRPEPGKDFPPSVAALSVLARRDSGAPTFDEAVRLIFGAGGVLRARPPYPEGGWRGNELREQTEAVQLERAETMHPLIGAYVRTVGLEFLRRVNLDDPEWGAKRRRELEVSWTGFVQRSEERGVARLAGGRRGGLARLDPLSALGVSVPAQLEGRGA